MQPIFARLGHTIIYSYTVLMLLGLAVVSLVTVYRARRVVGAVRPVSDLMIAVTSGALLFGRVGFVVANRGYFSGRMTEALNLFAGGHSYFGAVIGGLLGLALFARLKSISFAAVAEVMAPSVAVMSLFGWGACLLGRCAAGSATSFSILADDLPDAYGIMDLRYQTQLLGILSSLTVLLLIAILKVRDGHGFRFWLALLLLSATRLPITLLRGDFMPTAIGMRLDTIGEITLALLALALVIRASLKMRSPDV